MRIDTICWSSREHRPLRAHGVGYQHVQHTLAPADLVVHGMARASASRVHVAVGTGQYAGEPNTAHDASSSSAQSLRIDKAWAPPVVQGTPLAAGKPGDILLVSGTRREIIKLAPVYHTLRETAWAGVQWLHTAPHDEMARHTLHSFDVRPDITLRRPGSSLLDFSLACREQLEQVIAQPFRVTRKHEETL